MMAGRPGNHYLAAKATGCGRIPTEGCPTAVDKLATLLEQATEVIGLAEVGSAMCAMMEFNRIQSVIESVVSGGNIDSDSGAQHRRWRSAELTHLCSFKLILSPKTVFPFQVGV